MTRVNTIELYRYSVFRYYPSERGEAPGLRLAEQLKASLTEAGIAWKEDTIGTWQTCEHLIYYDADNPNNWNCVEDERIETVISVAEADATRGQSILATLRLTCKE